MTNEPRNVGQPRPGFFRVRLVKGGPLLPARIWRPCHCTVVGGDGGAVHDWTDACDRFPHLVADINGEDCHVDKVWLYGEFMTGADGLTPAEEYKYQLAKVAYDKVLPRQKVDLSKAPPVF